MTRTQGVIKKETIMELWWHPFFGDKWKHLVNGVEFKKASPIPPNPHKTNSKT